MSLISAPAGQQKTCCLPDLTHDSTSEHADQSQDKAASPLTYQQALDGLKKLANGDECDDPELTELLEEVATRKKTLSEDHPKVADTLWSLALHCKCLGNYKEAEALSRRALEICEKIHGTDHLDVAEQLEDLAYYCLMQNKYEETERYCRRVIDIYETKLAADDLKIAHVKDSLGLCYFEQNKYNEAKELFEQTMEIYELKRGPDHFLVTTAKSKLDSCKKYIEAGKSKQKKKNAAHERKSDENADEKSTWQEHVAAKKKVARNVDSPGTSSSAALAGMSTEMPSTSSDEAVPGESLPLIEQMVADARAEIMADRIIMEIDANSNWNLEQRVDEAEKTCSLPTLAHDLVSVQAAQSQDGVASPMTYQQALDELKKYGRDSDFVILFLLDDLATRKKKLGENDPDVADALNNVVQRCRCLGMHQEAEAFGKRALEILEAVHGKCHVEVAEQLKHLALSSLEQKKYEEAERYYHRVIAILETKHTVDDLKIAEAKDSLGWCYYEQKKYKEAEELFKRVLEIFERKLAPGDERFTRTETGLASCHFFQGKYKGAKELFTRVLKILELKYGPDHFLVTRTKSELDSCKAKIEAEEFIKTKHSIAQKRTFDTIDADGKCMNSQGHGSAKKARVGSTVDPRATSSAELAVAATPMPSLSSNETTVPKETPYLIRLVADVRAKMMAEFDRQLSERNIMEIEDNSHLKCKQRTDELQAEIEEFARSQSRYEQIIGGLETKLDERAQKLSSSEEKIKNLERSRQETLAKSARLEAEIGDRDQRLFEAKASIETSKLTIAELQAEIAKKSRQLAEAQQTIESHLSCSICKDEDANRMWSECHHVATCEKCASKLLLRNKGRSGNGISCPICQTLGFPLKVFI